ncbi:NAD(P)H-dependent glycerol-3-phosphate dehydrogenase [Amnibacterium endophyticum]|uniref:Glycerol-3-phosphate dehydrogenase n=1 Tax=Amnibacterium endophyticum TaxID=2109337 RepID=A0ABW4LBC4_9MICO
MSTVTILGAGAMGSALATPLVARGHAVRLWGTWLDDHLLDAVEAGHPHPRTGVRVPAGVEPVRSGDLDRALDGADLVVLATSSEGVEAVITRAAPAIARIGVLAVTSKGLLPDASGDVQILPTFIRGLFEAAGLEAPAIVAVGGPCKANEVAAGRPTATVYGSTDLEVARRVGRLAQTDAYRIEPTADVVGLEVSAPLKNVYAIALGYADGLAERTGEPWHDLKAAVFAQAVREMAAIAEALGGSSATVFGLAGTGDLEVTGLSGRNRIYGARIGAGETPADALTAMRAAEQTVEGAAAIVGARSLAGRLFDDAATRLPLLHAIDAVLDGHADPLRALTEAALPEAIRP